MKSVFFCHSSGDKPFVRKLATSLRARGIHSWIDEDEIRIGDSLLGRIGAALEASDFVIVVLSRRALQRPWVLAEMREALTLELTRNHGPFVLPVLYQHCVLPPFLHDKKYADFSSSFESGVEELVETIEPSRNGLQDRLVDVRGLVEIDLRRLNGTVASFRKRNRLKCVRGQVDTFVDTLSADGAFRNVRISPGDVVEKWAESGQSYFRSRIMRPLRVGHTVSREMSATLTDAFTRQEEYFELKIHYPTEVGSLTVRFPKGRPPKSWNAFERRGPDSTPFPFVKRAVRDGRAQLVMTVSKPRLDSGYVLVWEW
jgi:hypothetical protein